MVPRKKVAREQQVNMKRSMAEVVGSKPRRIEARRSKGMRMSAVGMGTSDAPDENCARPSGSEAPSSEALGGKVIAGDGVVDGVMDGMSLNRQMI